MSTKQPWLSPDGTGDNITISLSRPTAITGVTTTRLNMRAPTLRNVSIAQRQAKGDREQEEILLFASILDCSIADIEGLSVRDYHRVQEAYFRFISEDADGDGNTAAGATDGDGVPLPAIGN